MAVKFWQAVGKKGAISLPFLMNTEVKNKKSAFYICKIASENEAIFYFTFNLFFIFQ